MSMTTRSLVKVACLAYGVALTLAAAAPAQAAITLADSPLFLTVTVPPNITVTLDDSGSMARAYVPEICDGDSSNTCSNLGNRYAKASRYNLIHYDPTKKYPAAKDANGNDLSTTFTAALVNGFDSSQGTVNLQTHYQPTAFLDLPNGGSSSRHGFMRHYSSDVTGSPSVGNQYRCRNDQNPRVCQVRRSTSHSWTTTAMACTGNNNSARDASCAPYVYQPAYYYIYDGSNSGCSGTTAQRTVDNDCYDKVVVSSSSGPGVKDLNGDGVVNNLDRDELQNFANWYSFARTRNLATQTATSLAFADLDPDVRVAWQALNSCRSTSTTAPLVDADCDGWRNDFSGVSNAIRPFTGQHKTNFYRWLFQLPTDSTTPLPSAMDRVGRYYSLTSGLNSPYNDQTGVSGSTQLTCRRNYHVMMTDGIWNTAIDVGGNIDGSTDLLLGDETSRYSARDPYSDQYSNTLADVAFHYWATDLYEDLDNGLQPSIKDPTGSETDEFWNPRNNPATWQHMVNFTIGLGLSGFLNEAGLTWTGDMFKGSYEAIAANTAQWPNAYSSNDNAANVADLWHAAINSRGQFFSADDPTSLADAFQAALTAITSSSGSSAALSANSTSLTGETMVYQAKFESSDWSGTLLALAVDPLNGSVSETPTWDAAKLIPAHGSRRIFTHNGTTGVQFSSCSNLSADQQAALNGSDSLCEARLQWLRGDPKDEVRMTSASSLRKFRNRPIVDGKPMVMGDIINSDPAYVGNVDYGYSGLPSGTPGQATYDAYRTSSRTPMVYVGSNDGRVYGIRGDSGAADSGVEKFSYIPGGVYHNLSRLTDPSYTHRYLVDGSIMVRDAFLGGAWKTVLVAGLNSGGRSIYALDVTDGASFSAANVMWEFDADNDAADLGFTFSRPQIGILENGTWVAVFGNGYNSPDGGAHLFIVDLATGTLLRKITAVDTAADDNNGLSTPLLVDTDNDRMIDAAYAGDLQGSLWKFDLSGTTSASWGVANGVAMFRAPSGQAITAQPKVTGHASGGRLVLFGTGRYLTNDDVENSDQQAFYGVWDNGSWASTIGVGQLQRQTFTYNGTMSGRAVRSVSSTSVDWGTRRGWYLDLESATGEPSERVVNTSLVVRKYVIFSSIIPSDDECDPGGTSWLNVLDVNTGGEVNHALFDLDNDGEFDSVLEDGEGGDDGYSMNAVRTDRLGISNVPVLIYEDLTPDDPNDDPSQLANTVFAIGTGTTGATETNEICIKEGGCGPEEEEETPPPPVKRRSWIQIR